MRKPPAISGLERHYKTIWGELRKIETEIVTSGSEAIDALRERMRPETAPREAALAHIEFCLRLFEPDWTRDRVEPKPPRARPDPDHWAQLLNWGYDVLRGSLDTPLSSAEILNAMPQVGRLTAADYTVYRSRLTGLLRGQERLGSVRSSGTRPLCWSIVRSPPRTDSHAESPTHAGAQPRPTTAANSRPTAAISGRG